MRMNGIKRFTALFLILALIMSLGLFLAFAADVETNAPADDPSDEKKDHAEASGENGSVDDNAADTDVPTDQEQEPVPDGDGSTDAVDSKEEPAEREPVVFIDVPRTGKWYSDVVYFCGDNGLVLGDAAGTFRPADNMSRVEFLTIIYRDMAKLDNGEFFAEDERFATSGNGWKSGGTWLSYKLGFEWTPEELDRDILREEFCAIMYRAQIYCGNTLLAVKDVAEFADASDINADYLDAVYALQTADGVSGYPDGRFLPKETATRAEICQLLYNMVEVVQLEASAPEGDEEPAAA